MMQTYDASYLKLANNMLKSILKLIVVGLCIPYHLKPLHV
jgi:hypothetical protein